MPVILLNSGDKVLSNDGSSFFLLNGLAQGLTLIGTHATAALYRTKEQLITVDYTIRLIASTVPMKFHEMLKFSHTLSPTGIYNDAIRDSLMLHTGSLKEALAKYVKYVLRLEKLTKMAETLSGTSNLSLYKLLKELWGKKDG